MEERVRKIIAEQLEIALDEVTNEKRFVEDLGADSLDIVELVMSMEDEFDTQIPNEDAERIQSVGDAVSYVKKACE